MSGDLSVSQRVLDIVLKGKGNRIPEKLLPKKVELDTVKSFFGDIPEGVIEKEFGKVSFLIHKTFLLTKNLYNGTIESLLLQLAERGIPPHLHMLSQVLERCNSLAECLSVLQSPQFRHLKGAYNSYITVQVYKQCQNFAQRKHAEKYFARWGNNRGAIEALLGELIEKDIPPNLHILNQILERCNSLAECLAVLQSPQLRHLKGTYDEYTTRIVYQKCETATQREHANIYLARWGNSSVKESLQKKTPDAPDDSSRTIPSMSILEQTIAKAHSDTIPASHDTSSFGPLSTPTSLEEEARAAGISVALLRIARANAQKPLGRMGNVGKPNKKGSKFGTKHK